MKTIVVKTQKELDELPKTFENHTAIQIKSESIITIPEAWENSCVVARENSRVEAWENSRVEASDNSRVEAWENSRVDCFLFSTAIVHSALACIGSLLDNSRVIYKTKNAKRPQKQGATSSIVEFDEIMSPSFEQWIERGYVVADGITQKLKSSKTIGNTTIFEVADFLEKETSYVARAGDKTAHGKTIEETINDLRYKLSDRDVSKYKHWKINDVKSSDELIEAYMAITGACSFGTKQFCESIKLKDEYNIKEIFELTKDRYGNAEFVAFFRGAK